MTSADLDVETSRSRTVVMGVIHYGLLGFAMWASYLHWYALVRHDGQPKIEAAFIAGCIDLSVYLATLYRQRDYRIGRKPKFGFCTFPNFALFAMICVSASGNVAEAKHSFGGVSVALIPTITFLLALTLGERDLAETDRRRARQRAEARAVIKERADEERRQAERERQRREAAAETERLAAEKEAERLAREERRRLAEANRLALPPSSQPATVSANVSAGGLRAVPPPEAGANTVERQAMWAHWVHVIKTEHRAPSGAELLAAGACSPESSLGRRMAKRWQEIEPAASVLAKEATGS
jgi:hypothetical protein